MLAVERLAGVTPEVDLRNANYVHLRNVNKAARNGFEPQRRHHQKFKKKVPVAPK